MTEPCLLLIDVQEGLDDPKYGRRNNPEAEDNIKKLLDHWRHLKRPVIHVRHCSTEPDSPLRPDLPSNRIKPGLGPLATEKEFTKTVNSAFIGTQLEMHLREHGQNQLVVVGLTTDHCVSTSVRMAANLGFSVTLVSDATATFERKGPEGEHMSAEVMHNAALASLQGEFCVLTDTQSLLEV
ncbi:MAG: cysteine hydrolase family protein [Pseudomonadota bacterium]